MNRSATTDAPRSPHLKSLDGSREQSEIPETIAGYRLLECIGRGGSGVVYRGENDQGRTVAIKVLADSVARDPLRLMRFYQEAKISMRIEHPNLVQAYEVGEDNGRHYILMEYVKGRSLASEILAGVRFSEARALKIALLVARGLRAAHKKKVLHRDVSPKNILLTEDGQVKLADLEFSKHIDEQYDMTVMGSGLGTPDYMSPEQFRRAKTVDQRSDLYGLGATLYVVLTRRLPFGGMNEVKKYIAKSKNDFVSPDVWRPTLSESTNELIKSALDAHPGRRPQTASAFVKACKASLAQLQQPARESANPRNLRVVMLNNAGRLISLRLSAEQLELLIDAGRMPQDARVACPGERAFTRLDQHPRFRRLVAAQRWRRLGRLGRALHDVQTRISAFVGSLSKVSSCFAWG